MAKQFAVRIQIDCEDSYLVVVLDTNANIPTVRLSYLLLVSPTTFALLCL